MTPPRDGGFALVLVLWTVALLTVIAGSFAFAMRAETSLTGNLVERAQAEALAEGGLRIGIARLLEPSEANRWRVDGTVYETVIADHSVRVALQSERGKVDLNRAPEALIRAVVEHAAAGEPAGTADAVTDAILDWRDGNRTRRLHGAEDAEYAAAGRAYGSRDGPFVTGEELTQVLGVTPALFEQMAPLVTVHSGRPRLDPGAAPREMLMALPGVTEEHVDAYLAARDAAAESNGTSAMQLMTTSANVLSAASRPRAPTAGTFTVLAEARVGDALVRRAMVVRARPSASVRRVLTAAREVRLPFAILAWADQPRAPRAADGAAANGVGPAAERAAGGRR